jgi:hypothetical protein
MPAFSGSVLDSPDPITDRDLYGRRVVLLFVMSADVLSIPAAIFARIVYALWSAADGTLCMICVGTEQECRDVDAYCRLRESYENRLTLIVDPDAQIFGRFRIPSAPSALLYDETGLSRKIGRLSMIAPERAEIVAAGAKS